MIIKKDNKRYTIALILASLVDNYEQDLCKGVLKKAEENDINLLVFVGGGLKSKTYTDVQRNAIYNHINRNIVDGFIVVSTCIGNDITHSELTEFLNNFKPKPIVSIGTVIEGIPSVLLNNSEGMRELVEHLINIHGYKNIAFIKGPSNNQEAEIRFNTYVEVLKENNIKINEDLILPENFLYYTDLNKINNFIKERYKSIDAIICVNDYIAIVVLNEIKKLNLKVPDDIKICGFDNLEQTISMNPSITTVEQSPYIIGMEAFNILLNLLDNKVMPEKIELSPKLIIRESCGCNSFNYLKEDNIVVLDNIYKKTDIIDTVLESMKNEFNITNTYILYQWASELTEFLVDKNKIAFLEKLKFIVYEGIKLNINIFSWNQIINHLFRCIEVYNKKNNIEVNLNNLWKESFILLEDITKRYEVGRISDIESKVSDYYPISELLISCFNFDELKDIVLNNLPKLKINSCYVLLYSNVNKEKSRLIFGYDKKRNLIIKNETDEFNSIDYVPKNIDLFYDQKSYYFKTLFYKDVQFGFIIIELNDQQPNIANIYENFAIQISNAIRNSQLFSEIKDYSVSLELKVKERTKKLTQANKELKKLDKLKNDFIANITHDFRSPLTGILNISELILKTEKSNKNKDDFELIYNAGLKLKGSINRLLELAKLDANVINLNIEKIDIINFLNKIIDYYMLLLTKTSIKIINNIPINKKIELFTDEDKLEEIINNIISNAIKFVDIKKGIVEISLKEEKNFIIIKILDNGVGIPKDKLKIIFDRFEQLHKGRDSRYGGTGIGLAFSKQLADLLKCKIWAESEGLNKGACLFIKLSKKKKIFEQELIENLNKNEKNKLEMDLDNLIKYEIQKKLEKDEMHVFFKNLNKKNEYNYKKSIFLIIDDDKNITKIIMKYLSINRFYNFIITNSGKKGIDAVYMHNPDIIICDYNMPNIKGDEIHDSIITNPKFTNIPFVFLSAIDDEKLISERREKGASAFLKKPIDEKDLILTVTYHLKKYFQYLKTLQMATVDELTGLYNRRETIKRINDELSFRRYSNLSIIFFDIDFFKIFNDKYGHQFGDKILKEIGRLVKLKLRDYDIPCRYGGDEFLIVLPDTDQAHAVSVAEILKKEICAIELIINSDKVGLSASFGVVSIKENEGYILSKLGLDSLKNIFKVSDPKKVNWDQINKIKKKIVELLLKMSDEALYESKSYCCNNCGFKSNNHLDFINNKCTKCDSEDIKKGRNNISVFNLYN